MARRISRGQNAWRVLAVLPLLIAPVGCLTEATFVKDGSSVPAPGAAADFKQVKAAGACLELGETQKAALTATQLVRRTGELLDTQGEDAARRFVWRYPDVALDALRSAGGANGQQRVLQFIAQAHDSQCTGNATSSPWTALWQQRSAQPQRFTKFDAARQQLADTLQAGKTPDQNLMALARETGSPLLEIDAARLMAEARLRAGKTSEAIDLLNDAVKRAQTEQPYQAVELTLLLGEAQRRAGKTEEAPRTWQQAVTQAGRLAQQVQPVTDPILWERIAALRPANCGWPDPALMPLIPKGQDMRPGLAEACLWAKVGQWRLERGESQAALLAYKRAESLAVDAKFQDTLQLGQAQALAQLNQRDSAITLLAQLAVKPNRVVAAPALALLGGLKLKEGNSAQALAFLEKAMDVGQQEPWPTQAEALADLGLAYLILGEEVKGLDSLHAAQKLFERNRQGDLLHQCLDNEIRYLDHKGKTNEANQLKERLRNGRSNPQPQVIDFVQSRNNTSKVSGR